MKSCVEHLTINNYNELSPLPVDMITGKVIPFGSLVERNCDDSLHVARPNVPCSFVLTCEWWTTQVQWERWGMETALAQLEWETQHHNEMNIEMDLEHKNIFAMSFL